MTQPAVSEAINNGETKFLILIRKLKVIMMQGCKIIQKYYN